MNNIPNTFAYQNSVKKLIREKVKPCLSPELFNTKHLAPLILVAYAHGDKSIWNLVAYNFQKKAYKDDNRNEGHLGTIRRVD